MNIKEAPSFKVYVRCKVPSNFRSFVFRVFFFIPVSVFYKNHGLKQQGVRGAIAARIHANKLNLHVLCIFAALQV